MPSGSAPHFKCRLINNEHGAQTVKDSLRSEKFVKRTRFSKLFFCKDLCRLINTFLSNIATFVQQRMLLEYYLQHIHHMGAKCVAVMIAPAPKTQIKEAILKSNNLSKLTQEIADQIDQGH